MLCACAVVWFNFVFRIRVWLKLCVHVFQRFSSLPLPSKTSVVISLNVCDCAYVFMLCFIVSSNVLNGCANLLCQCVFDLRFIKLCELRLRKVLDVC